MPTVLIVDDDKHTRSLLERILHHDERIARHGIRLLQAGDGVEGLRLYDAEKPDVVITDLLMPRMDGFRFCKELRARGGDRLVGLLVLSGVYRDGSIATKLRDEYAAAFYTKPYQIKDLVTALDKQLERIGRSRSDDADTSRVDAIDTPPPVSRERRGRFQDTPLSRVLCDLHEERATGTLSIRRGRIEKQIDLVVGHPVAVSSNQRGEMLGDFLILKGLISERVHQTALERAHNEEKKLGEALTEMGILTAADLVKHLTGQARYKITRSLRWPDGEWSFVPKRELLDSAASKGNALDPVAVVLLGLKKTASVEHAAQVLAPLGGHRVKLTARGAKVRHTIVRAFGEELTGALDAQPTVEKLLGPPFEAATSMPALEALLVTGCLADTGLYGEAPGRRLRDAAEPPDVEELSGAFKLPLPPSPPPPTPHRHAAVYDQIFADEMSDVGTQSQPADAEVVELLEFASSDGAPEEEIQLSDSSLIEVHAYGSGPQPAISAEPEVEKLRDALLKEYLRLQGKDAYETLRLAREADAARIEAAFAERMTVFALELYAQHDFGRDYGKLEEIHAAYRRAHDLLASPEARAAYDREVNGKRARATDGQMMGAELAFRAGDRRLSHDNFAGAVEHFRLAVDSSPDVADYQAAYGWSLHRAGGAGAREAAQHLAQALAIDPDHAAAHEYLGRMLVAEGKDDEAAADHLEAALDAKPPRLGALEPLEQLRARRGELPSLERLYRSLLRRDGEDGQLALRLWRALGRVYASQGQTDAARTAFETASRLSPNDPATLDALASLATTFEQKRDLLRARWLLDPGATGPLGEIFRQAVNAGRYDTAFLGAAALMAQSAIDEDADAIYRRYRPRFLARGVRPLDAELWPSIRHPDDDPEVGALFAVLAPAGQVHAPLAPADLHVPPEDLVADGDLSEPFRRVRAYVAHMLGVPPVRVALRADFGGEAHLGALPDPVLLVGPDTLACPDKVELAFRLGRAMSYLRPGRAFAGSRPARVLKELFVAALRMGGVVFALEDGGRVIAAARALAGMPRAQAEQAGRLAAAISSSRPNVNLSSWSRSLARSADRVGLVLCGDPVVAANAIRTFGGDQAAAEVLDYALSGEHARVRDELGVSIEV